MSDEPISRAADGELLALLADERARTLARAEALTRDFDDIVERSSDASRDDEHDPEGVTVAFERAQVAALLAAAHCQIAEVELAHRRLLRGEHSTCARCGVAIPRERHLARPTTRTCVNCAG